MQSDEGVRPDADPPHPLFIHGLLTTTTSLVTPRPEGFDLVGADEPEDEILEQPAQHGAMRCWQRGPRGGGGEGPPPAHPRQAMGGVAARPTNCRPASPGRGGDGARPSAGPDSRPAHTRLCYLHRTAR